MKMDLGIIICYFSVFSSNHLAANFQRLNLYHWSKWSALLGFGYHMKIIVSEVHSLMTRHDHAWQNNIHRIWKLKINKRVQIFLWKLILGKLPTYLLVSIGQPSYPYVLEVVRPRNLWIMRSSTAPRSVQSGAKLTRYSSELLQVSYALSSLYSTNTRYQGGDKLLLLISFGLFGRAEMRNYFNTVIQSLSTSLALLGTYQMSGFELRTPEK